MFLCYGDKKIRLHVQDREEHQSGVIELDARMSRRAFAAPTTTLDDIHALLSTHRSPETGNARPLFRLDMTAPRLSLEMYEPRRISFGVIELIATPGTSKWVRLISSDEGAKAVSVRIVAKKTRMLNMLDVWQVSCSLHLEHTEFEHEARAMRAHHVMTTNLPRPRTRVRPHHVHHPKMAELHELWCQAHTDDALVEQEYDMKALPVRSCLSWSNNTIAVTALDDVACIRALCVAHRLDDPQTSLLHTPLGQRMLKTNMSPAASIMADPNVWVKEMLDQRVRGYAPIRARVDEFQQRINATLFERLSGAWDKAAGKVSRVVQRFMPSKESVKKLTDAIGTSGKAIKTAATSEAAKTALSHAATVAEITGQQFVAEFSKQNPEFDTLFREWGRAVIAAAEERYGKNVITRAAAFVTKVDVKPATEAMRSILTSLKGISEIDLKSYGQGFIDIVGSEELRDGILRTAKLAAEFVSKVSSVD